MLQLEVLQLRCLTPHLVSLVKLLLVHLEQTVNEFMLQTQMLLTADGHSNSSSFSATDVWDSGTISTLMIQQGSGCT